MTERTARIAEWSALAALAAPAIFSTFCPTPYDLKRQIVDGADVATNVADLRRCYLKALGGSLAVGVVASLIAGSPIPALGGAGASGLMLVAYEDALPPELRLLSGSNAGSISNVIDGEFRRIE